MRSRTMLLGAMAIACAATPIAAQSPDPRPCQLFSATEIASVTGVSPAQGQPDGPDTKEFPGATTWTCGWLAGESYFAARILRFRSAAEATQAVASSAQFLKSFPEGLQLAAVPGPGDQAFWGSSPDEGAVWVVRTGPTVFAVILAGELKKSETLREPLRKLVVSGLAKLP